MNPATPPVAYSYRRWSTPAQTTGDSLRRQTEATAAWCERNGVRLDASLKADQGVSGFRGDHRHADNADRYALAGFLELVNSGRVAKGSYLIVESLDRLSREDIVPAVNLFTGILLAGVRIVQLHPSEQVFTDKADMTGVMLAILELSRGNSESRMKSVRNGAVWQAKRERAKEVGRPMTGRLPFWLRIADGKIVTEASKVEVVRRLFTMSASGQSIYDIARTLNAEGVAHRRSHWTTSNVAALLGNRAVLGEFQPHTGRGKVRKPIGTVIPDYYPAVIEPQLFFTVRQGLDDRRYRKPGRPGKKNLYLFSGLLRDARNADTSIQYTTAGNHGPRLVNAGALALLPGHAFISFPAEVFEACVLSKLAEVDVADVLPGAAAGNLASELAGKLAEQEHLEARVKERIKRDPDNDALFDMLRDTAAARKSLVEQLAAERQRSEALPLATSWGEMQTLAMVATERDRDTRLKLRTAIRRVVSEVWCLFLKRGEMRLAAVQVYFSGGKHRDYLICHRPARKIGGVNRARQSSVKSFVAPAGGLDLRDRGQAAKLEQVLAGLDVTGMG